ARKTLLSHKTPPSRWDFTHSACIFSLARWSLTKRSRRSPCTVVCHQQPTQRCSALMLPPKARLLWLTGAHRGARGTLDEFTAISGDFLSAVISIRYILGFRKDNPNVFNMLVQNLPHCQRYKMHMLLILLA